MTENDFLNLMKKELSETRNLIIKTDNMIMGLSTDIKLIQKKQESYEMRHLFNSIAVYILFVVIICSLAYLGFNYKFRELAREKADVEKKFKDLREEMELGNARIEKRDRAEREALEIYRAIESGKSEDTLKNLSRLNIADLSAFEQKIINDKVVNLKKDLSQYIVEKVNELLKRGDGKAALLELQRGKDFADGPQMSALFQILTAQAYMKMNETDNAIKTLETLVNENPRGPRTDTALLWLGDIYQTKENKEQAKKYYTQLMENFKDSQYYKTAWRRARDLDKKD